MEQADHASTELALNPVCGAQPASTRLHGSPDGQPVNVAAHPHPRPTLELTLPSLVEASALTPTPIEVFTQTDALRQAISTAQGLLHQALTRLDPQVPSRAHPPSCAGTQHERP
jgi:hypothetical protein